jgi:dinuclear metal center YbgI/SA1388 family protein
MVKLSMVKRQDLDHYLHQQLSVALFKDYGPNGLQVEGKTEVHKVVSGVTASLALIEAAIAQGADAILVHHGLFWRGHDGRLTGWMKQRVAQLLARDINLFAYHLPLDAHPQWGNNVQLGARLGWAVRSRFGEQDLGCLASLHAPTDLPQLAAQVESALRHAVVTVPGDGRPLRHIAWCTGGAQSYFESAIAAGADVFVTGEISEPQAHYARETGVAYLACGHHASERYGAQALGEHLASQFGLEHVFIDIDNPA